VEEMASTNCLEIVPFFGLYDNNGDQLGFGFASYGLSTSNHFEHPPAPAVKVRFLLKCQISVKHNI